MKRMMWMGARARERWVPAPQSGMEVSPIGWTAQSQYLNGGTALRASFASHQEYAPAWNTNGRDALRPIGDMARGMYGSDLIFFLDPMAMDKNVLPYQWSVPALASEDGPVLWGQERPESVPTASNSLDYPAYSAQYVATTDRRSVYIPVPPGHTAWVGWHGEANGTGGLEVTPVIGPATNGAPVAINALPVGSDTRVSTAFSGDAYRGIEIRFGGGTATTASIAGVIVQILASTDTPQTGPFISGQGHSGCRFNGKPTMQAYSSAAGTDGLVSMSAKLVEVGDFI